MANEEHLAILEQGVTTWNKWRIDYSHIRPDLTDIYHYYLPDVDLRGANLSLANLSGSDLGGRDLSRANLDSANLSRTNLDNAILSRVNARGVSFLGSSMKGIDLALAQLKSANLIEADLLRANLFQTNLTQARLSGTNFTETNLKETDFMEAWCERTIFSNVDLSNTKNLQYVNHAYASVIDVDTLIKSKRDIPVEFIERCGIPQSIIENFPYFIEIPAIQYYSCFISYSTQDEDFAKQLNDRMKREKLRVWFAPEEMKGGKKIHEQLYEAIHYHDKLILVLSEASMKSNWVQREIQAARKRERLENRQILFPIRLVEYEKIKGWKLEVTSDGEDLVEEICKYFIPDFCNWKNYDKFNEEFDRLLKALQADE